MAGLHLVTGYKGSPHVTSADQGAFNAYTVGTGEYVLTKGNRFEAEIKTNNTVRIYDGCLMMNGRYVTLDAGSYLDATISNGSSGMKRHDIISVRYEMNLTTGIESVSLVVNAGSPSASTPVDPAQNYGETILNGVTVHEMPLHRVILEGLTITKVEPLFKVFAPLGEFQHGFYKQNMLVNGDFNCNQRGSKTYDASTKVMYTLDMWRAYGVKVTVLASERGIKLDGVSAGGVGYFTQFIDTGKLVNTPHTISAMVDDQICTFTVTPDGTAREKNFGKFKISAVTTSTYGDDGWDTDYNRLKINISPIGTNSITVKYVDVFEGTVAYPHVKEDPATALARCSQYVQAKGFISPLIAQYTTSGKYSYRFGIPYAGFKSVPTITYCFWRYYTSDDSVSGNIDKLTQVSSVDNVFQLRTPDGAQMVSGANAIFGTYVFSCEYNPDGD